MRGHSGRETRGSEWFGQVNSWAKLRSKDEMLESELALRFLQALSKVRRLESSCDGFFRGRTFPSGEHPKPCDMGPPMDDQVVRHGRYNAIGKAVLYLSDSVPGVQIEFRNAVSEGVLFVQRFELPLDVLHVADFRDNSEDFLDAVFDNAERCAVGGFDADTYNFSQIIGELVSQRFDGMIVPGVRGRRGAHYSNVVVFKTHPAWPDWLHNSNPIHFADL